MKLAKILIRVAVLYQLAAIAYCVIRNEYRTAALIALGLLIGYVAGLLFWATVHLLHRHNRQRLAYAWRLLFTPQYVLAFCDPDGVETCAHATFEQMYTAQLALVEELELHVAQDNAVQETKDIINNIPPEGTAPVES